MSIQNTPGLLLVLHENPFPVTINQTWLQSGIFLKIKSKQQTHSHAFTFRMAVNVDDRQLKPLLRTNYHIPQTCVAIASCGCM